MSASTAVSPTSAARVPAASDVVRATALTKRLGEGGATVDALRGVDVSFPAGSFTAIMGPSGSGPPAGPHRRGERAPAGAHCDDATAAAVADRVLFLADGRVVDEHAGLSVEEILDHLKAAAR